ncbi:class I SAM-dependent methyltransferase [Pseudomonas alcaligenes]|uniref:class I SAM-dependent methyltransferase n=1 Tax=Aquipseudomonas alcaligenes TaxID=43263 RepID=UPI002E7B4D0F|nr:class I SAM-dependent methyltransferase [Pseudomonas alcaligenes]MEE1949785.1 class I SAM-dependent methyltransferase [Pseudomonas alcaligenes]
MSQQEGDKSRGHAADSDLIRWKTNAWQDPNMVAWYSGRMVENTGTNYLKNALEIDIIQRFVSGREVIDIGTGTGRAALALLRQGYQVTGIDSSQAMLDETKRLAGGSPINLKLGDIQKLPCADASFDSAVALNVMVHFPNWREALHEWRRVVRPGGRLLFDIHSSSHVRMAYGVDRARWPEALRKTDDPHDFANYMARLDVAELVEHANAQGLTVRAVVPYGAFLGGGNVNWLLYEQLERSHRWKRVLSWFACDPGLAELGLFLEQKLVGLLSPSLAGRVFVVLENRADPAANASFAQQAESLEIALSQRSFSALQPWLDQGGRDYAVELRRLLQPLRARHFFFSLFDALLERLPDYDFRGLLMPEVEEQLLTWRAMRQADRRAMAIAQGWSAGYEQRFRHGVDVAQGSEYFLVESVLTEYFGLFTGERT